ncbi:MAG: asparaginase [Proteobacteria bacterium]|nr:asparaginase [Pseudomonadota bacterium]
MKNSKILVIYTGGTFGMSEDLEIPALSSSELKERLASAVPEMKRIAPCEVKVLFNTDSCQMGLAHWFRMAELIRGSARRYRGVVILHGTDTLAYTGAALSYLLSGIRIPVVLTGAQKPLTALRNDARTNFLTALEVAARAPKELRGRVLVAFHDEVYLASRIRKLSAVRFGAFESPRFPILARVGSTIRYENVIHHLPALKKNPLKDTSAYPLKPPAILKLEVTPEFPGELFTRELLESVDGILLTLFTSGTAPTESPSFLRFLENAKKASTPVFAITERGDAPVALSSYAAGKDLLRAGVLWCRDLTPEAAFVKAGLLHLKERQPGKKSRTRYHAWLKKAWSRALSDEMGIKA